MNRPTLRSGFEYFLLPRIFSPHGIGVATGEMCMNRVMFKQLLQANAIEFCQIDSARMGGVNEILAVYFMAKKFNGSILDIRCQSAQ